MLGYDYHFKIILLGEASSGKSSFSQRLINKTFASPYHYRMVQFEHYKCEIDNFIVRLQLWDTAGQERFRIISPMYYRNAMGIVLVFDVCQRQTFRNIDFWMAEASRFCPDSTYKVLVGNKIDLKGRREVSEEEARAFAADKKMPYFESSAKENINVENIFLLLAEELKRVRDSMKISSTMFGSPPIQPINYQNSCW